MLLRLIAEGRMDPLPFGTHRFKLWEIMDAYATFADAAHRRTEGGAVGVVRRIEQR
jgi:threonine dehydrogenase-like Zn-dependent dehydrogenase